MVVFGEDEDFAGDSGGFPQRLGVYRRILDRSLGHGRHCTHKRPTAPEIVDHVKLVDGSGEGGHAACRIFALRSRHVRVGSDDHITEEPLKISVNDRGKAAAAKCVQSSQ